MPRFHTWDEWAHAITQHLLSGLSFLRTVFEEVWAEFRAPVVFVKTKIRLALLILFGAIALLGGVGSWALSTISERAVQMMEENYKTMAYTRQMSMALTEMLQVLTLQQSTSSFRRVNLRKAFDRFERYLELLQAHISAEEERTLLEQVKSGFTLLRGNLQGLQHARKITPQVYIQMLNLQDLLESVYQLNEEEIRRKSAEVKATADRVSLFMIMLGLVFFIFAMLAMYYFPLVITRPVAELHHGIRQIAAKNYSERLDLPQGDEFGMLARAFNEMAEQLEYYEKLNYVQLLAEKQRIETLINETRDAIFGLDSDGTILFANRAACNLLGASHRSEVVGHHPRTLVEQFPLADKIFHEILSGQVEANTTLPSIAIDHLQKELYYSKDVLLVRSDTNDHNPPFGYLVVMKNVTELKQQDLAKTRFMATLSHELKTPLSAIGISLRLLQDHRIGSLNEEQRQLLQTIHQNASRLLQMVNEVLDISRIETGKEAYELAPHAPCELAKQAIEQTSTLARDKSVMLVLQCLLDTEKVVADAQKTIAILTNLLSNAIRYAPKASRIEVQVRATERHICFSVKDQGPGIDPEELPRLFHRYERARGDRTRGTGLGLAISNEFAKGQNGRIEVESTPGKGSTFTLVLPRHDAKDRKKADA